MGRFQHRLSKFYGAALFEQQLKLSLADPIAVWLRSHLPLDVIRTENRLFQFDLRKKHCATLANAHGHRKLPQRTSLNVTKGKLNDCISSLASLLLKIMRCVVRYILPCFVPLNTLSSCPDHSIVTFSENSSILQQKHK